MKYDFHCRACDQTREVTMSLSEYMTGEEPVWPCPECGSDMRQFIGKPTPVHFRGDGWPDKPDSPEGTA